MAGFAAWRKGFEDDNTITMIQGVDLGKGTPNTAPVAEAPKPVVEKPLTKAEHKALEKAAKEKAKAEAKAAKEKAKAEAKAAKEKAKAEAKAAKEKAEAEAKASKERTKANAKTVNEKQKVDNDIASIVPAVQVVKK